MLNEQDEKYTQEIEQLKTEVYSWLREERVEIPEEVKSAIEEAFSDGNHLANRDGVLQSVSKANCFAIIANAFLSIGVSTVA